MEMFPQGLPNRWKCNSVNFYEGNLATYSPKVYISFDPAIILVEIELTLKLLYV